MNKEFFGGKKVLVMGLGRFGGGLDAAVFTYKSGAKVTVTDSAGPEKLAESVNRLKQYPEIELHLGEHCAVDFADCDVLVVNPAVRPQNEFIESARKGGAVITSQIEMFFEMCPARIVGITGSNGKSTTTALTAYLLKAGLTSSEENGGQRTEDRGQTTEDGRQKTGSKVQSTSDESRLSRVESRGATCDGMVWLGGNIGNMPLLTQLGQIRPNDLVVLELSSFQLEQLAQSELAPHIAVVTNLAPNHLDRHGTFENYCKAKENIFILQKRDKNHPAVSIFNADDTIAMQWYEKYKNEDGRVCLTFSYKNVSPALRESFALPGRANLENLAAAVTVAKYFGVEEERLIESAGTFRSLPHRLEPVAEINGTWWYNDSVSTTPESSIVALNAFKEPKIIIAGGYDKGVSFEKLGREIAEKAKAAVLIGKTSRKIAQAIDIAEQGEKSENVRKGENEIVIKEAGSLSEAVDLSAGLAGPGEVVLLSPGCASYDMFDDFRHRGEVFKELITSLRLETE